MNVLKTDSEVLACKPWNIRMAIPLAIWGLYLFITQIVSEHEQYAGQWII